MSQINALAIVELGNSDQIIDTLGSGSYEIIHGEFLDRLSTWVRPSDHSKKLGSNRFLAVLKGVGDKAQMELAIAKLERIFREPFEFLNEVVEVDIHAGITAFDRSQKDMNEALKEATQALVQAKGNNVFYRIYNPSAASAKISDKELLEKLSAALNHGEFQLYYQPKFHAGFKNMVGAEALLRWHTQGNKVVTPDEFIGVAEQNEVGRSITWWVIKTAVARLAKWPQDLSIAVNIPPALLTDQHLYAIIADALELHGVKPARLTLEVTERLMIQDQEKVFTALRELKKLGIRISIDDFGTGFSSFAYFRNFPADELKIDKSFVSSMLQSKMDRAIVKSIIDLAHNFTLKVVAEGVEDEHVADRLSKMGCDILQGYYFDKPLPTEEFEKRYRILPSAGAPRPPKYH